MNVGALSTSTVATCVSSGVTERAQGLRKLQQGIENNLVKFRQHSVRSYPARGDGMTYFPEIKWFSNDRHASTPMSEKVRLGDSFARLPTSKPLSGYKVAIIIGEGGFFQGLRELDASCDLTLQIDHDPKPLQLSAYLLEECRKETKYPENYSDKIALLNRAITRFKEANQEVNEKDVSNIVRQFNNYITGMERNIFSSAERFAEFKRCQDHPVQQACLDIFSEEDMTALAETLKDHNASVRFLNISNACEYPEEFYKTIPYDENGANINFTPSRYIQRLPFSDDAICAYSQRFGGRLFTATATIQEMADALYGGAISGRNRALRALAFKYDLQLYTWFLKNAVGSQGASFRDLQLVSEYVSTFGTGPSLQLPTRIFRFFANHPIDTEYDWILWLTAARLTSGEVEELKAHKDTLTSDYFENHPTSMSTQPPLFIKILDRITAEPTLAETGQPVDSTASSQAAAEKVTAVPMPLV
ncbi:hypothetical protein [Endozoicomonas sp. SESOKO1]|uniref:hypothetical protein n=1 Tax=Endozoicomonas sp. SESOKO1 TaxID=2828742 RepID=UPI0021474A5F|nr:hypothetical protein [Endozoicomonas sp. SESOKO1]